MRKSILVALVGVVLTGTQLHAGNGDLIVDGNVGIGISTPQRTLQLGNDAEGVGFEVGSGTPNAAAIRFGDNSGWRLNIGRSRDYVEGPLNLGDVGVIMTIQDDGNVGIGTLTPAYNLDVSGTIRGTNVSPSDLRFKENIIPVKSALDKVKNLQGVIFNWKTDQYKDMKFPTGRHYGVIAQEIEKTLPEVVSTAPDGAKAVAYTEIIPVLIEAIKEQQKMIELLEKKLKDI